MRAQRIRKALSHFAADVTLRCRSLTLYPLEQQLSHWLLMMSDYVREEDLRLTHELIALTLGVRRAGVSEASSK